MKKPVIPNKKHRIAQTLVGVMLMVATAVLWFASPDPYLGASEANIQNIGDQPLAVQLAPVVVPNGNLVLLEVNIRNRLLQPDTLQVIHADKRIPLSPHPVKARGIYFALVGISYYASHGTTSVVLEWTDNLGFHIQTIPLDIVEGSYRSERISVTPRMVSPSRKDVNRIQTERSELKEIYANSLATRTWETPFDNPVMSDITSPFGSRRVFNGKMKSYHSGVDYRAPIGTPVYAANSGTVKLAKNLFFSGNLVLIDHGQGLFTQYGHLSEIRVSPGQQVEKGDQIGLSGATGRVNGPHLHWGVKLNGVNIDPLQLMEISQRLFTTTPSHPTAIGDIQPDRPSAN